MNGSQEEILVASEDEELEIWQMKSLYEDEDDDPTRGYVDQD